MPKAVISNRIYLDYPGQEQTKKIISSLTYKFSKNIGSKSPIVSVETVKTYKQLPRGIISIPQMRTDLIPENYEIVDKRVLNLVPFPKPVHQLREAQQPVYDKVTDTCFINALVGWGKTMVALHLASKFSQKTLVITHTTALRDQWIEEVESLYNIKPGIIGSGQFDIEDHFIVIGNIQSLIKHTDILAKEFGTVILDEAHHCPASTFTNFLDSMHARYRIGLSGTINRKDGKHKLFNDYFGGNLIQPPQSDTLTPVIKLVKTNITLKKDSTWVEKISELVQDEDYIHLVTATAQIQMSKGHCVLIVADRVDFLRKIAENIGDSCVLVTGETSLADRQLAKEQLLNKTKLCVAGSRQIFSEGISINILSCVILAVPISNDSLLEQIIGRIQRQYPDKKVPPEVIDMQFAGWADKKQNNDRLALYLRKGWKIISI